MTPIQLLDRVAQVAALAFCFWVVVRNARNSRNSLTTARAPEPTESPMEADSRKILMAVMALGPCTSRAVAHALRRDPSETLEVVHGLVTRGLATRGADRLYDVTDEGRAWLAPRPALATQGAP